MHFPVMKGTRCKRNLIITIIKTRPQEIHKATFFQATRDLRTSFLSARARAMRIIIPYCDGLASFLSFN